MSRDLDNLMKPNAFDRYEVRTGAERFTTDSIAVALIALGENLSNDNESTIIYDQETLETLRFSNEGWTVV